MLQTPYLWPVFVSNVPLFSPHICWPQQYTRDSGTHQQLYSPVQLDPSKNISSGIENVVRMRISCCEFILSWSHCYQSFKQRQDCTKLFPSCITSVHQSQNRMQLREISFSKIHQITSQQHETLWDNISQLWKLFKLNLSFDVIKNWYAVFLSEYI